MADGRVAVTGGSGFVGTNLVRHYRDLGWDVLNLDPNEARDSELSRYRKDVDILDGDALYNSLREFKPTVLLHLGARTDLNESRSVDGYTANTKGVQNVIDVASRIPSLERAVYASSRLVFRIDHTPASDYDYSATTMYGHSKVVGEKLVRAQHESSVPWTIVRPTSIWGPWFDVPYRTFFTSVQRGRYVHPKGHRIKKSFGYVGNAVHQIERLAAAPVEQVGSKVFFLADYDPLDVLDWANEIRVALDAPSIKEVPLPVLRGLALAGDLFSAVGINKFPLTSFRLNNLITNMVYDLDATAAVVGKLPYSETEGVALTADWLRNNTKD